MRNAADELQLLADCHARAIELLERNQTPAGILAAAPTSRAEQRGYTAIFGRDAAICALGLGVSGSRRLEASKLWPSIRPPTARSRSSSHPTAARRTSGT